MKIEDFQLPNKQDIPGRPKGSQFDWLDAMLEPYARQIRALTQALQGQLGPQNQNQETKTVVVRHGISTEVNTKIRGRPTGAQLIAFSSPGRLVEVQPTGIGKLSVTMAFDDLSPEAREITILISGS